MRSLPGICCLSVCALFGSATPARAAFHDWRIKEIFSSADGTVQFIEFFTGSAGQQFLDGHTIDFISEPNTPGQSTVSFTLNGALTVPVGQTTANRHFLVATAGFGALAGGVAPNYFPLPANFINLSATNISISFAHGADATTFAMALLPKDGVNSLRDTVTAQFGDTDNYVVELNSPTNFSNASGSVNVGTPTFLAGDFDENSTVAAADLNTNWRGGFGMIGAAVDHMDGDADDDDDVDGDDFLVWQQQLGQSTIVAAGGAVPEPATGWLASVAMLMAALRRRHGGKLARV